MKTMGRASSSFCCDGKRQLAFTKNGHAQMLLAPLVDVFGTTVLHRIPDNLGRGFGEKGAEAQQQAGQTAAGLLFFQLLETTKSRFQHLRTCRKAFTQPSLSALYHH